MGKNIVTGINILPYLRFKGRGELYSDSAG